MKSNSKCDFAHPKIDIFQKFPRFVEPGAGNVIDKLYARHLFELFAQMSRIDPDRLRDFAKGNFFGGMFLNELARFPDVPRFGAMVVVRRPC